MHIETVNIHFGHPGALASAMLAALSSVSRADGSTEAALEPQTATEQPPRIGELWHGKGGIYLGLAPSKNGAGNDHVVMSTDDPGRNRDQKGQIEWAAAVRQDGHEDFHLMTAPEGALIYANARDKVDRTKWHWTSTQSSASGAFSQDFSDGNQDDYGVSAEGWARAVRRFPA